jgi:hypothetical protein
MIQTIPAPADTHYVRKLSFWVLVLLILFIEDARGTFWAVLVMGGLWGFIEGIGWLHEATAYRQGLGAEKYRTLMRFLKS